MFVTFEESVNLLKAGKPLIFKTDTIYGIGVAVRYAKSPAVIYKLKHRDDSKPIAWLVANYEDLDSYGISVVDSAKKVANKHWPGALTLIIKASKSVPPAYLADNGTIGLRMPNDEELLRLIDEVGPIAASSANISGSNIARYPEEIDAELLEQVPVMKDEASVNNSKSGPQRAIYEIGEKNVAHAASTKQDSHPIDSNSQATCAANNQDIISRASTIIDFSGEEPIIIRQGDVYV